MAAPIWVDAGNGVGVAVPASVPYPTAGGAILAGDFLLLAGQTTTNPANPILAGWTEIAELTFAGNNATRWHVWYYKIAAGGESGSVSITSGTIFYGRIYRFRGQRAAPLPPYEAFIRDHSAGVMSNIRQGSVTTLGPDRLVICEGVTQDDGIADPGNLSGGTGTWTKRAFYGTGAGLNHTGTLWTDPQPSAGTVSGGATTTGGATRYKWNSFAIGLIGTTLPALGRSHVAGLIG